LPQAPQFAESVIKLRQAPLHEVVPVAHDPSPPAEMLPPVVVVAAPPVALVPGVPPVVAALPPVLVLPGVPPVIAAEPPVGTVLPPVFPSTPPDAAPP
jgi:hypothetical protein